MSVPEKQTDRLGTSELDQLAVSDVFFEENATLAKDDRSRIISCLQHVRIDHPDDCVVRSSQGTFSCAEFHFMTDECVADFTYGYDLSRPIDKKHALHVMESDRPELIIVDSSRHGFDLIMKQVNLGRDYIAVCDKNDWYASTIRDYHDTLWIPVEATPFGFLCDPSQDFSGVFISIPGLVSAFEACS